MSICNEKDIALKSTLFREIIASIQRDVLILCLEFGQIKLINLMLTQHHQIEDLSDTSILCNRLANKYPHQILLFVM